MKKGFTLVELLAVIVILAIIAVIAIPQITNVVSKARKSAAVNSVYGYVEAIENQVILNSMKTSTNKIEDGTYYVEDLSVNYKGKGPDEGIVTIEKGIVKSAKICIGKYSIDYIDSKASISNNNYCSNEYEITLNNNGEKSSKTIKKVSSTTFEVDVTNMTNVSCNNGAVPSIESSTLTISNIYGDTECTINNSIKDTFDNLDNTETNIVMFNDETLTDTLTIAKDKTVNLDLNGNKINYEIEKVNEETAIIINNGLLMIDDNTKLGVINTADMGIVNSTGIIEIKNISINAARLAVYSPAYTPFNLKSLNINCTGTTNQCLCLGSSTDGISVIQDINITSGNIPSIWIGASGITNITGKIHINSGFRAIVNNGIGTVNLIQDNSPIYIKSTAIGNGSVISNLSTGTLNVKANRANACTSNSENTTSGLCVYTPGDEDLSNNTGFISFGNNGHLNIDGGTYFSDLRVVNNDNSNAITNIKNAEIIGGRIGVINVNNGLINICNSKITSTVYDIANTLNTSLGTINYDSNTIFTNGTNTPIVANNKGTINSNYTGTCTE